MPRDRLALARAERRLGVAARLCREAVDLVMKGDPDAPADHISFQDDLCGVERAVNRALLFVRRRRAQ